MIALYIAAAIAGALIAAAIGIRFAIRWVEQRERIARRLNDAAASLNGREGGTK